ncbi:hypothetical protein C7974DRAFT_409603 [Boeremia exigua]|uniref:uncharacterized protein n=1 Tax=Boeremia exigua TaxID=749465 RepID=UPI001E8DAC70|nr:uncharacterized protein C7974DRAFT_409603 [Boeremia exigua]KAH6643107.1 hypothetical protein C7974DRAFT_409603 [Boeremia exigua]
MPATPALYDVFARSDEGASSGSVNNGNGTLQPLDVVCAWPVSSQYGAGSRFLYYVLVATCVLLRKAEWLRNACLAAALLVPSIGALHGIVLAFYHVNGAVDLDVFGAWQLCTIAIIAVPTTLRISGTYFNSAGRNLVFLWTILLISGLIALCVEFSRVTATDCSHDEAGIPNLTVGKFPYGNTTCNLTCSEDTGPYSDMRGGSAKNIYVVPVPSVLTFNAAMLIAAGVCIPAILSLMFTWDKILESSYRTRRKTQHDCEQSQQSDAIKITPHDLKGINTTVTRFLGVIEIPLFGGIVLAILIVGEINFFSNQLMYMTEPMASIGQWSPIAGTCMAALGSLYVYWSKEEVFVTYGDQKDLTKPMSSHSGHSDRPPLSRRRSSEEPCSPTQARANTEMLQRRSSERNELQPIFTFTGADNESIQPEFIERLPETDQLDVPQSPGSRSSAGRGRVRDWLESTSVRLSEATHRELDTKEHKNKKAYKYPMIPGEDRVNEDFDITSKQFTEKRLQRVASSASSIRSNGEGPSTPSAIVGRARADTGDAIAPVQRQDTLEVPAVAYHSPKL